MTERPEQDRGDSKAAGAGDIVVGRPMGDGYGAVTAYSDPGWGDGGPDGERDGAPVVSASALLRSKWLIGGVFLAVSAVAVPAVWMFGSPTYTATATVHVKPVNRPLVRDPGDSGVMPFFSSYMATQIATITNPDVLQRVLDRDEVKRTAWWDRESKTLRTLLGSPAPNRSERLKADLVVAQQPNTELISIQLTSTDPADTDVLVNAVADEYLRFSKEKLVEDGEEDMDNLRKRLVDIESRRLGYVDSIGDLSKQLGTDNPDIVRSQLATELGTARSERGKLELQYRLLKWKLDILRARSSGPAEGDVKGRPEQDAAFAGDRDWRELKAVVEECRREMTKLGELNPRFQELQSKAEFAESMLKAREKLLPSGGMGPSASADLSEPGTSNIVDEPSLVFQINKLEEELKLRDERIKYLEADQTNKGDLASRMAKLKFEQSQIDDQYQAVSREMQRRKTEPDSAGRILLSAKAVRPSKPTRDRRLVLSVVAMAGAWMAGFAVAYLRTARNPKILEARDVQRAVHVPFLGELPPLPTVADLRAGCDPRLTEGIRMVRTALLERVKGTDRRVVLITSSSPEAGKSTVTALLSKSLAALGQRVLLVEADLRKPSLSGRLGIRSDVGLSELLTGATDDPHAVLPTDSKGLDIVLSGRDRPDFSAELLANGVFAACLKRWRGTYDFILLDSPPVLPVADARILAGHADGILMVLRSSHSRRAEVVQAYADLSATGTPLLGTILVGDKHWRRYPYDYSYSERRDAHSDGALEA